VTAVQGRVVSNHPLAVVFVAKLPKYTPLPMRTIERLLNRERLRLGRHKGCTWWLSPEYSPDPLFIEGRLYAVLRQVYADGMWVLEHVGECRVLPVTEGI
jgi:hypothetical protein